MTDDGAPAQGSYDGRSTLWDAATAGNPVGTPVIVDPLVIGNGLFSVTLDFGNGAFTGAARWLQIGVRPHGSPVDYTVLSPRQTVTPVPMALYALTPAGPVGPAGPKGDKGDPGSVGPQGPRGPAGGSGTGTVVLSTAALDANLIHAGYVKIGTTDAGGSWETWQGGTAPSPRQGHYAVWTGSEMLVWGGFIGSTGAVLGNGGRYDPAANRRTEISVVGAPAARRAHSVVWTGSEMIVWGGFEGPSPFNDGGRYNPVTDSWTPISSVGAPSPRFGHSTVWTGSEMIVWGGAGVPSQYTRLNDGGRYQPASGTWTLIPSGQPNQPAPRYWHTAVWTCTEMVV